MMLVLCSYGILHVAEDVHHDGTWLDRMSRREAGPLVEMQGLPPHRHGVLALHFQPPSHFRRALTVSFERCLLGKRQQTV
jgi:hypothetical protein